MPLGHLGVNVADLSRAKSFYDAIMPMLAFEPFFDSETEFSYRPANERVGTWIFFYGALEAGTYSPHRPGLQHLAFMVDTRQTVDDVLAVAVGRGAVTIHEPREFPQYHEGYYAAFLRDLDGFTIEIVCHRDKGA
jgi:catechol 2,3-dioxygenase-like lactoylglutathione lyase family enzyme